MPTVQAVGEDERVRYLDNHTHQTESDSRKPECFVFISFASGLMQVKQVVAFASQWEQNERHQNRGRKGKSRSPRKVDLSLGTRARERQRLLVLIHKQNHRCRYLVWRHLPGRTDRRTFVRGFVRWKTFDWKRPHIHAVLENDGVVGGDLMRKRTRETQGKPVTTPPPLACPLPLALLLSSIWTNKKQKQIF